MNRITVEHSIKSRSWDVAFWAVRGRD